jgi:hypothetical protein
MLSELLDSKIDFLLVGAYAMAAHGFPRATGDIDIWVRADAETGPRTFNAIKRFGAPLHDLTVENLSKPGYVFQIGVPPIRIDILTTISGLDFSSAWEKRVVVNWDGLDIPILALDDLVTNKRATGRTKDVADAERLEQS